MSFIHSMKFRFTVWYLLVLAVLLTTLSVGVYSHMARTLHRGLDASLRVREMQLRSLPAIYDSIRQGELREELGEVVALYFHADGQLVKVSPGGLSIPMSEEFISQAIAGTRLLVTVQTPEGERLRLLGIASLPAQPAEVQGGLALLVQVSRLFAFLQRREEAALSLVPAAGVQELFAHVDAVTAGHLVQVLNRASCGRLRLGLLDHPQDLFIRHACQLGML